MAEGKIEHIRQLADNELDVVIDKLNEIYSGSRLDLFMAVGKVIVDNVYDGSVDALVDRGERDPNLRALLARKEELALGKSELSRSLGVYALDDKLRNEAGISEGVAGLAKLSASHFTAVLGLDFKDQRRLLERAEKGGWTTRKMESEAAKKKAKLKAGEKRGRPPLPAFQKTVHRFGKMLADEGAFDDTDDIAEMDADEALKLYRTVTGMKLKLEELQRALEPRATGFVASEE
jgi:hypothetical protein